MNLTEAITKAKECLPELTDRKFNSVTGISNVDGEWKITLELIERKGIPDTSDILGIYELSLGNEGELISFNRSKLRRRGDAEEV